MKRKNKILVATDEDLRAYCDNVRRTSAAEFKYMMHAAAELRAALVKGAGGRGYAKAWLVSWHFILAAKCAKSASGHAVATYASFLKWFDPELKALVNVPVTDSSGEKKKRDAAAFEFGE